MSAKIEQDVRRVASIIVDGGVVAYPTEAVWGIGCRADNMAAVQRILRIKQRVATKGLICMAHSWRQVEQYTAALSSQQQQLCASVWPGFTTVVLAAAANVVPLVCAADGTLALRVPSHTPTRNIVAATGSLLVSTSANIAGAAPVTTLAEIFNQFGKLVDVIYDAPLGYYTQPSPIIIGETGQQLR